MLTFDESPVVYQAIGNLLIILAGILSIYVFRDSKLFSKAPIVVFAIAMYLIVLLMMRMPAIVYNHLFNPDENLFIVGAMTLAQEPIYWDSVDGCTSGPLNFYIITLFCELFHQPYDYISGRTVGILLMLGSIIFYFLSLKKLFSTNISFISLLPAVSFLATTTYSDFIHFSSEHLPIFLLGIIAFLYSKIATETQAKPLTLFVMGLIAGLITLTKLQAIPIAFCLILVTYWLIYTKHKLHFLKLALWLTTGGLIVFIMTFAWAIQFDVAEKIWIYYLKNNLSYGSKTNLLATIYHSLFDKINIFIRIIAVLGLILSVYYFIIKRQFKLSIQGIFVVMLVMSTLLSVYKTGHVFHHYLLFLIFPATYLYAFFLKELSLFSQKGITTLILIVITTTVFGKTLKYPLNNQFISANSPQRPLEISATSKEIMKYLRADEPLVIWGDDGRLYLETKRIQGITWSNSHWGMYSDSLQRHFEDEFIKKFTEKPFPVFVDAHPTKGTFMTRDKLGFETKPTLKKLIDSAYTLVSEFDEKRVYVRNERFRKVTYNTK